MHADDYQLETQILGIACVNDTNLNHDLGDSLEPESSSTERFPGNNLKQKSENLANIVQKIIKINMQPADEAKLLRKSLETSVSQTVMDYLMLQEAIINHNESKLLPDILEYRKGLDLRNVESRKVFFEFLSNIYKIDDDSLDDDNS